jgi:hypothetical protein
MNLRYRNVIQVNMQTINIEDYRLSVESLPRDLSVKAQ